jgi:hypothetical protein
MTNIIDYGTMKIEQLTHARHSNAAFVVLPDKCPLSDLNYTSVVVDENGATFAFATTDVTKAIKFHVGVENFFWFLFLKYGMKIQFEDVTATYSQSFESVVHELCNRYASKIKTRFQNHNKFMEHIDSLSCGVVNTKDIVDCHASPDDVKSQVKLVISSGSNSYNLAIKLDVDTDQIMHTPNGFPELLPLARPIPVLLIRNGHGKIIAKGSMLNTEYRDILMFLSCLHRTISIKNHNKEMIYTGQIEGLQEVYEMVLTLIMMNLLALHGYEIDLDETIKI